MSDAAALRVHGLLGEECGVALFAHFLRVTWILRRWLLSLEELGAAATTLGRVGLLESSQGGSGLGM